MLVKLKPRSAMAQPRPGGTVGSAPDVVGLTACRAAVAGKHGIVSILAAIVLVTTYGADQAAGSTVPDVEVD
jgi:hypothetical protein